MLLRRCSRDVRSVALVVGPSWQPSVTVRLAVRCTSGDHRGLAQTLAAGLPALAIVNPHGSEAQLREDEPTHLQDDDGTVSVTVAPRAPPSQGVAASKSSPRYADVTYTRRGVRELDGDEVRALAHALASTSSSPAASAAGDEVDDDNDDVPFEFMSVTMNEFFDAPTMEDAVRLLESEFGARIEAGMEGLRRGGRGAIVSTRWTWGFRCCNTHRPRPK